MTLMTGGTWGGIVGRGDTGPQVATNGLGPAGGDTNGPTTPPNVMHYGRKMTRVHASQDLIGIGGHQPSTKEPPEEPAEELP